ncbi:DNA-3-methyladenine glycosylase 2 family protein [Pleurocapsales cyanobacterium LEGE 06147]|nr:DNA-3-methyladenine glycosylase 2 family protein [Pleurocapsales cyanobacterium LEGE 06147]
MTFKEITLPKIEIKSLTEASFTSGLKVLAERDKDIAGVLIALGPPPVWKREAGFPTLIHIILEQQVSVSAAKAVFNRLSSTIVPLTPENFLTAEDLQLKAFGFSRQKTQYGRALANVIINGQLDLAELATRDETVIRTELKRVKGIGDWTVDIYLLMALQRPNVFPKGDLALAIAAQQLKGLAVRPTPAELESLAENWQPWRAIAARILWHYYLNSK